MRAYYFGCWRRAGHFFHEPGMRKAPHAVAREGQAAALIVPWGYGVDGKLCPPGPQVEGRALMNYREGWSALAFWDRSVDDRGGSNSVFLFEAILDLPAALAQAREIFPEVFERFDFQVVSV